MIDFLPRWPQVNKLLCNALWFLFMEPHSDPILSYRLKLLLEFCYSVVIICLRFCCPVIFVCDKFGFAETDEYIRREMFSFFALFS